MLASLVFPLGFSWRFEGLSPSSGLLRCTVKAKEMGTVHVENALSTCDARCDSKAVGFVCEARSLDRNYAKNQGVSWSLFVMPEIHCSHAWRSTLPVTMHFHKMNKAKLPLCPDLKHVAVDVKDIKLLRNLVPSRVKLRKSSA